VLILTVWTLFFLSALAVAVGAYVDAGIKVAAEIKRRTFAYYLARAGVEKAVTELMNDTNSWDGLINDDEVFRNVALAGGFFSVTYHDPPVSEFDNKTTHVRYGVVGEEGRININRASEALLRSFLEIAGGVDSVSAAEISAAIIDWRDKDDEILTGGAESSYYHGLTEPHDCRNGWFELFRELLLVKGMQQNIFERLEPYLTVFGTGKINLNSASSVVLLSLADSLGAELAVGESLATKIVRCRDSGSVFSAPSADKIVEQMDGFSSLAKREKALFESMMSHITLRSTCFRGTAIASVSAEPGADAENEIEWDSRITFVFRRSRGDILYWYEF